MTGAEALRQAISTLRAAGVETPQLDARLLLAHAIGVDRGRLALILPDPLPDDAVAAFTAVIARRARREPVSHILGGRDFFDRWFAVTSDVLDPRPETETLVAAALPRPFATLLDLGTGSGAIGLTLLAERAGATGVGTDLSAAALDVAARNAVALGLVDRLRLIRSDWYEGVTGRFDLIVSNPPYIAASEMAGLARELRCHEPRMALTDEADGLTAYRVLAAGALDHLTPGGWLMVETGPTQGAAVAGLFAAAGLEAVSILPDLDGRDRVVEARAPRKIPAPTPPD